MNRRYKDGVLVVACIALGVLTRTVWHIAPNVEFVTALTLVSAYVLRKSYSLIVPLGIMVISDLVIGNSMIFVFTWSAFSLAYVFGKALKTEKINKVFSKLPHTLALGLKSEGAAVISTLFFYLWTNFGVVVVSNMYPKTLEGVLLSYQMGLPFLVPQLIGNMIIVPAIFLLVDFAYKGKLVLADRYTMRENC